MHINKCMLIFLEDEDIDEVLDFGKTNSITTAVDIASKLLTIVEKENEKYNAD